MLSQDPVVERVRRYIDSSPFHIRAMVEFGSGVVCVDDTTNKWDTYFDRERWRLAEDYVEEFGDDPFPPALGTGLGVIELPKTIRSLGEIFNHVREILEPVNPSDAWYEKPREVKV